MKIFLVFFVTVAFIFLGNVESKTLKLAKINEKFDFLSEDKDDFSTILAEFKPFQFLQSMPQRFADLPNSNFNISVECLEDLILIGSAAANSSAVPPALAEVFSQMMDAMAKEPPGVFRGAQNFFGFKQECDAIKYDVPNRKRDFRTLYSRAYMNAYGGPNCTGDDVRIIGFDICMPSSCGKNDLEIALALIPHLAPSVQLPPFCSVTTFHEINEPMETMSWIMVSFFVIVGSLAFLSAITDYFLLPLDNPLRDAFGVKLFLAFSFYKNVSEILSAPKFKQGQIGPLNCLRVISMLWVIVSHVVANCIGYTNNALDYIGILDYPLSEIIENAWFSVDTFFFIGGVLLSFMWFKSFEKDKRTLTSPNSWIMFYVHRFIRLSAPYYVLLLSHTYLFGPITQNMPLFFAQNPEENIWKKYLWKNLLYIFNFNLDEECLAHAWYLATDLQMYIFTPLIVIPLAINPIFGWIVASTLLFLSTAANVVTVYVKDYPATQAFFGPGKMPYKDIIVYDRLIYYAAWIRCQVYIMGLLVGWFLQRYKRVKINSLLNIGFWMLGAALMLTDVFGLFHYFRGHQLPLFWRAAYSALSKPAWGLGLSWVIISCYYGYGGPINQFMSWNIWVPLGKLSYCAYLVHYPIINYVFGLEKNAMFFSSIWQILYNYFIPVVAITGVLALLLSALVEVPVGKLEVLLLKPKAKIQPPKRNETETFSWETTKNGNIQHSSNDTHF